MIEYIHGDLTELTPALAIVETAGVGYGLNISLNTYTAIQGKQEVEEMTLSPFSALLPNRNVNSTASSSPFQE